MIEVFAGGAVLTSVAKQYGLGGIAVDKVRKQNARSTIYQLDLLQPADRELLEQWLASPLLLWAHFAPVCGTASRAREIPRPELASAPQPLRSLEHPLGLPDLNSNDRKRVEIANELFKYTCHLFAKCMEQGVLATMENPRGSYLWVIPWVLELMRAYPLFAADFQACMYGSMRDKWTRVLASFPEITQMDAVCDRSHKHLGWGFTTNAQGQKVWATAEESQYPRKLCIALTQIVLQVAASHGVQLRPNCIHDILGHPLLSAKHSQMAAGRQPRGNKIPPLVPDFQQTAVFFAKQPSDIPCSLMGKLPAPLTLMTEAKQLVEIPKHARFLRGCFVTDSKLGVAKESEQFLAAEGWPYKVVFGLPWDCEQFVRKAVDVGHPSKIGMAVPKDLQISLEKHMSWSEQTLVQYRMDWCRKWLKRARQLDRSERLDAETRPQHVKDATANKKLLLTEEILKDMQYEDMGVVDLMRHGSTLAGDIPKSETFEELYRPCMLTLSQLLAEAPRRNEAVLAACKTSGDAQIDQQVLNETREEVRRGWAIGPIDAIPAGGVVSRRFPLIQKNKTRMIDDFTVSGINDTAASHNKVDLHMVDTFTAVIREFFRQCAAEDKASSLVAKTYDLKSAYRQVPIRQDHLCFSYFCIYNCEKGQAEIYQLLTLPFGATHSVYSFLRLARMLYTICTRQLYLLTTNFYDDYILASLPNSIESAKNSMELVFLLTGWNFDRDGKKATSFGSICKALGVQFDLSSSGERILAVCNTEQRIQDLTAMLSSTLEAGELCKQDTLILRGKLGFADSFLHGRLGLLVLKQLAEHAYGRSPKLSHELRLGLLVMKQRLELSIPRIVSAQALRQWVVFTDAAFEPEHCTGGIGAALFDDEYKCVGWFGFPLSPEQCKMFGSDLKQTIIYELELAASILALDFWAEKMSGGLQICYGDNDSARFSLIRGSCLSQHASALMRYHLEREAFNNLCTWYARVPTEANVSDYPSRAVPHPLLLEDKDQSFFALEWFTKLLTSLEGGRADYNGGSQLHVPREKTV